MIYFVSGHRDLTQDEFNQHYIPIIDEILKTDVFAKFIVGDWEGCDTMFVEYLVSKPNYPQIAIYGVGTPRITPFKVPITAFKNIFYHSLDTYDNCDTLMTQFSDFDIAWVRKGREDSHTAQNIKRRYGF